MRSTPALFRRLGRYYAFYAAGFVCLVIFLAVAEQLGLSPRWIGQIFLFSTIAIYAAIGVMSRTSTSPNTTWPVDGYQLCSTAWPRLPTG